MNLETISDRELKELFQKSRDSPRKRAIKTFHDDTYEGPQVCLNVIQPGSYIRPHYRYIDEAIIHYSGVLCSIQFDEHGRIKKTELIGSYKPYLFLPQKTIQSIVALRDNSAIWMVVQGPHDQQKFSEYLASAPPENQEHSAYAHYLETIAKDLYS